MVDLDNLRTRFCKNIQKTRRVWLILAFVLHVWREFWSKRPSFKNQCLPRWVCSTLLCMGKTEYQHAYRGMYRSFNAKLGWFLCWTYNTEIWKSSAVCVLVFGFPPTEQGITHLPRYASIFQHMAKTVNLDNFPAIIFEKSVKTSWFLLGLHLYSISGSNFCQFSGSFLNYTLWKHQTTCCFLTPHAIFSDNVDQQFVLNSMLVCSCPGFYRGKRPPGLYTPNANH